MATVRKPKSASKALQVTFKDGTVIQRNTATETFVDVIRYFGPKEVSELSEFMIEGLPLVVPHKDYRMQLSKIDDNWFVSTHMSTAGKKRLLEKIAKRLDKDIAVQLI